jgi:hypothetical protein
MSEWLNEYAAMYGERIVRNRSSAKRIVGMTGLPLTHARALGHYCRTGQIPDNCPPNPNAFEETEREEKPSDSNQFLLDKNYIYNEEADTYITFLSGVPKPLVLPGVTHRELVRAYSNFDGTPASVNELARTFKLPRQWLVKYLRAHEITHDREPFAAEELLNRSEEDLAEEALQMRRASLYKRLEQDKWQGVEKDAMRYRQIKTRVLDPFKEWIEKFAPSHEPLPLDISLEPSNHALVICPTDFHWGKYAWGPETGDAYNKEIARERLHHLLEEVLRRAVRWGAPKVIYLGLGSDFGHADTDGHTTTKGTPQDMDGTLFEMIRSGFELSVNVVDILRQIAPVRVVALQDSNHDKLFAQYQLHYLDAWYRNNEDVIVNTSPHPRQYEKYGNTLMMFTHGDGTKLKDLPEICAVERPRQWADCHSRVAFTGHRHHEMTLGLRGMTVYQLWSMAGTDRWHARSGYVGSPKGLAAHIIDLEDGVVGSIAAPVMKVAAYDE